MQTLDKAQLHISDVKKVLIHQANEKMDQAILLRMFKLYNIQSYSLDIMPMTISSLGNSSVTTISTLLDLITRYLWTGWQKKIKNKIWKSDKISLHL